MNEQETRWLTVKEAAKYANVSVSSIRMAYYSEELRSTKLGDGPRSPRRFLVAWLEEWMNLRATGGEQ